MLRSNKRSACQKACKRSNKRSAHPQMCKGSNKRSAHQQTRKSKGGLLGTAIIFFVLIFGLVSFVLVKTTLEHLKASVKTEFKITLETDDRGTELLSLLQTNNSMEKLGYSEATNYTKYVDFSYLDNLVKRMDIDGKKKLVFNDLVFGNTSGTESIIADIPIPGGKTGRVELFV